MKKFLLIGLIFLLFSHLISKHIENDDIINAPQSDFRRKLLEYINKEYQNSLKEHFSLWQDSKQSINRDFIDELMKIAVIASDTNNLTLSLANYEQVLKREKEIYFSQAENLYILYLNNKDITSLISAIDLYLMVPNEVAKEKIDEFITILNNIYIDFPAKHLLYKENDVKIDFTSNHDNLIVDVTGNGIDFLKLTPSTFNITLPSSNTNQSFVLLFNINIENTFRITRVFHKPLINILILKYLITTSGKIELFHIADPIFWVESNNYENGINIMYDILRTKKWTIGNENNYNNKLLINKIILDERRLNIGSYYTKAYVEIMIHDRNGNLIQTYKTKEVEGLDNSSFDNTRRKINNELVNEIKRLF